MGGRGQQHPLRLRPCVSSSPIYPPSFRIPLQPFASPFDALSDPPFGGWCERRVSRTYRLKESYARSQTDVESCVPLSQETARRIHGGVCVVYFVLCGLPALGCPSQTRHMRMTR